MLSHETSGHPAYRHLLLREAFRRRRGGAIGTGGLPVVALRWDHGLVSFRDKVLPQVIRLSLPGSLAVNSAPERWAHHESIGVSPSDVNGWAVDHGIEIWNHGRTHRDAATSSDLHREIVVGKAELQAQVPSVPVECWAVPGVGKTRYGGFGAGETPEHWDSVAGRLILGHHAVSTSHAPGRLGPLTADISVLHRQYGVDSKTRDEVLAKLDQLVAQRRGGMSLFLHPSVLDLEGKISTAEYSQILERVAALRDRGLLAVMTMGALAVADPARPLRPSWDPLLSPVDGPVALSEQGVTVSTDLVDANEWVRGAPREIRVETEISRPGDITIEGDGFSPVTFPVDTGHQSLSRPLTIPLDADSFTARIHSATASGCISGITDHPI